MNQNVIGSNLTMRYKIIIFSALTFLLMSFLMSSYAKEMTPLNKNLIMIIKNVAGEKEEQMKDEAALESVKECVGRVYFSENIIIARELLEKYINLNYKKFIYTIEVSRKSFSSGLTRLELKIFVDNEALLKDLNEKRFLYQPKLRPFFYVFLEEKLDGQTASYSTGATAINNAIKDRKERTITSSLPNIMQNINILKDKEKMPLAVETGQKNEIEVIVTGSSETNKVEQKDIYYDNYNFYETKIQLSLIRVDTGEILAETESVGLAANIEADRAIELSIIRAATEATSELMVSFRKNWENTILDKADYKIMFTGLQKPDLDVLGHTLLSLGDEVKMYLRSYYYNVAVINLTYKGEEKELIRFLETFPQPTLKIISVKDNKIEISVRE